MPPLYEYECTSKKCGGRCEEYRSLSTRDRDAVCHSCGKVAKRVLSAPAAPVIGQGRSAESKQAFVTRQREQLTKRAHAYDQSPAGQADIQASIERVHGKQ